MLRRSVQVLSTFLPDKYGELCKALLDPRACCDRITFPVLESLEQNIFKILSIRTVALADLHCNLSPVLSCCSRCTFQNSSGTFQGSKFDLPKVPSLFFLVKSRLYFFKGSTFKPTSGLRNGAPPLFCFSNVLFFSSSVELNGKLRRIVFINLKGSIKAAVHAEEQRKL